MRITVCVAWLAVVSLAGCEPQQTAAAKTMEIGCAKCVYKIEGTESCAAAVKVNADTVLLTGEAAKIQTGSGSVKGTGCPSLVGIDWLLLTDICEAAKQAEVVGKLEGDKFAATSVKMKE